MSRSRRPRKLMIDAVAPPLEDRCRAYLARGLPPDATELDRVCFEGMANYLRFLEELRRRQAPPRPTVSAR